jgi:predicted DNA-binding transcriptional regulator AlpA
MTNNRSHQALLNLEDLKTYLRIGKTKIYSLVAEGLLPKPIHLGTKSSRWLKSEIDEFLQKQAGTR